MIELILYVLIPVQEETYSRIIDLLYKSLISKFSLYSLSVAVTVYLSTPSASQA
jgi:hypothetical protein